MVPKTMGVPTPRPRHIEQYRKQSEPIRRNERHPALLMGAQIDDMVKTTVQPTAPIR